MRIHMMIKLVILVFVFSIIFCVCQFTLASNTSDEKIVSLQKEIKINLNLLKKKRDTYNFYEDYIRPEIILIWDASLDGPIKFDGDLMIHDMTIDYYNKIIKSGEPYDPNELANSIKAVVHDSNWNKTWLQQGIMKKINKEINLLESKTASLQEELTQSLEDMASQSSVNNTQLGNNFKVINNAGIPGYNKESFNKITLNQCKDKCLEFDWCKSIDYEEDTMRCFVQPVNQYDAKLRTDYPNNPYNHYYRTID